MEFECICQNCSKPFVSTDEDAELCPECWNAAMGENEGIGEEKAED